MGYSKHGKKINNSDIDEQIRVVYTLEVSTSTILRITAAITNDRVAWQNRPLEPAYLIVWMNGIVFKKVINSAIYITVAVRMNLRK